jgi:hypothetical protein
MVAPVERNHQFVSCTTASVGEDYCNHAS